MEKAILKTLAYADIFDYPLKAYEIHKWLIGRKATLRQIEKALEKLRVKGKVQRVKDNYFLAGRKTLVRKRQQREKQSKKFLWKAKTLVWFLKVIPYIKLVGVSGGLAMGNADKTDDIDLFIITAKNRLWICRLSTLGLLSLTGQRRTVEAKSNKVAGKLCVNILLEEDKLSQSRRDVYLAHEVLQMKVLWQRDGIYSKYLMDNGWAFKFLPNWTTNLSSPPRNRVRGKPRQGSNKQSKVVNWIPAFAGMTMENLAKRFQLWYMKSPKRMERIENGAVYFHPNDVRPQVLQQYKLALRLFKTIPPPASLREALRAG